MSARIAQTDLLDERVGFGDCRNVGFDDDNGLVCGKTERRETQWMIRRRVDQDDIGRPPDVAETVEQDPLLAGAKLNYT